MKFKKKTITIDGEKVQGYEVLNPGTIFRGLKVFVRKSFGCWYTHEKTTGASLTPNSYPSGLSNRTREGAIQISAHYLSTRPEATWEKAQAALNYQLKARI